MLRRSLLLIPRHRGLTRIPRRITTQTPAFLSARNGFSTATNLNKLRPPTPPTEPPQTGPSPLKIILGGVVIGAAGAAAYQYGYLDKFLNKTNHGSSLDTVDHKLPLDDTNDLSKPAKLPRGTEHISSTPVVDENRGPGEKADLLHADISDSQTSGDKEQELNDESPSGSCVLNQEHVSPEIQCELLTAVGRNDNSETRTEPSEKSVASELTPTSIQLTGSDNEDDTRALIPPNISTQDTSQDISNQSVQSPVPLLDAYNLREKSEEDIASFSSEDIKNSIDKLKPKEDLSEAYVSEDGKLVLDSVQAIHVAEKRQAELDARIFAEEIRMVKEKYEKELKDARARELMYAEEAAILDKELNKERAKAIAALKSLQEKAEEKLKLELEQKEMEAELELKKLQELAKAELAAAIVSEKAAQIEKMAEANLNINALCMAFFARSEEARHSHSVHKLALGALSLEDALLKGLPVEKEIEALNNYLEGIDRDTLLDLVLSSLPEETRHSGTDTPLQLNVKFDALKGTLRHFSLIPPGGGGILTHSVAHVATLLKVKEDDEWGDSMESVISRVEGYLAEGKLVEAADALEEGVRGTEGAKVVSDWVKRARNRAITEQALKLLQSYATSVSVI